MRTYTVKFTIDVLVAVKDDATLEEVYTTAIKSAPQYEFAEDDIVYSEDVTSVYEVATKAGEALAELEKAAHKAISKP